MGYFERARLDALRPPAAAAAASLSLESAARLARIGARMLGAPVVFVAGAGAARAAAAADGLCAPVRDAGGLEVGGLCVMGGAGRAWSEADTQLLDDLAQMTAAELARPASATAEAEAEHFRTVFAEAALGMVILDLEGRVLELNPALERMLGYGAGALLHRPAGSLVYAADDACRERDLFAELVAGRRDAFQTEKRLLAGDGSLVTAQVTVSLLHDAAGRVAYALGLVEDITTRHVAEAMRQHGARLEALHELSIGVKHEINNVLATLQGNAELLAGSSALTQEERNSLDAILVSVQRLADAVCRLDHVEELPVVRYIGREWMVDLSARGAPGGPGA